jgi:uncharacterized surface protein with fasciclin (FAS1) repeats
MRKFLVLLLALSVLVVGIVPAFAQDTKTIADIVVESAGAKDKPEFTVLLAAVKAADPIFLETLSSKDAVATVFAPTDAAFGDLLKALNMKAEDLLANKALLDVVLAYHVVPGVALDAANVTKLDGALVGTVLPEHALAISVKDGKVMVNDSTVVAADVKASNGIVHVIDKVLVPADAMDLAASMTKMAEATPDAMAAAPKSIADTVIATAGMTDKPEFTVLLAAVKAADPSVLKLLSSAGSYTVFAPTDAAFAAALTKLNIKAEDLLKDQANLTSILAYHVVPGTFSAKTVIAVAGAAKDGVKVATLLPGTTVTIRIVDGKVVVNEATVVTPDVGVTNGVVHVIDGVLLPPSK